MSIGARIREERERLAFTQAGFAALASSSKRTQLNYEQDLATPNALTLGVWASVGLDVLYVVTGQRTGGAPVAPPTPEEQLLLAFWRAASKEVRRAALGALVGAEFPPQQLPIGRSEHGNLGRRVAVKKPGPKR